jgi:uncharacterized membrane protein YhaH (DUF805 family)
MGEDFLPHFINCITYWKIIVMNNKASLWEILKGSLVGVDGVGSNKRVASFYVVTFIVTALIAAYIYAFLHIVRLHDSQPASMYLLKMYNGIYQITIGFVCLLLGLMSVEQVVSIIKIIRGQPLAEPTPPTKTEITTKTTVEETPKI